MRTILFALGVSCASLTAFEGFYVGAGVGGHLAQATQTGFARATVEFPSPEEATEIYPNDLRAKTFDHDAAGVLYAGYRLSWYSLYLAAEVSLQFNAASFEAFQRNESLDGQSGNSTLTSASQTKIHLASGGFDLLPGWSPNPDTLIYGRVGVGVSQISLSTLDINTDIRSASEETTFHLLPLSDRKIHASLRVGGGLESRLNSHWSLRADYIYNDYGNLAVNGSLFATEVAGITLEMTHRSSVHLYDHIALLGLSYRFCPSEPLGELCVSTADYCGFYVGGALGGGSLESTLDGSTQGSTNADELFLSTFTTPPSQLFKNQFQGTLYLGYAYPWEHLYLGAEAFITAATDTSMHFDRKTTNTTTFPGNPPVGWSTESSASITASTCQYGVDLRPGFFLTPLTLIYTRVGVAAAEIKVHPTAEFVGVDFASWGPITTADSANVWKAAFRLGLGLEQLLSPSLHLRADYIFTNLRGVSFDNFASGVDSIGNPVTLESTLSTRLQNHALLVGLSYTFH